MESPANTGCLQTAPEERRPGRPLRPRSFWYAVSTVQSGPPHCRSFPAGSAQPLPPEAERESRTRLKSPATQRLRLSRSVRGVANRPSEARRRSQSKGRLSTFAARFCPTTAVRTAPAKAGWQRRSVVSRRLSRRRRGPARLDACRGVVLDLRCAASQRDGAGVGRGRRWKGRQRSQRRLVTAFKGERGRAGRGRPGRRVLVLDFRCAASQREGAGFGRGRRSLGRT